MTAVDEGRAGPRREGLSHWEGEPVPVLEALWGVPRLQVHERVGSTNDVARELADAGAPTWTTVVAEEQEAGRGRSGSRWHSPAGLGLWLSLLLDEGQRGRPPLTPLLVGLGAMRAIAACLEEGGEPDPRLEWPNDVYLGGRKVAGVLCEGTRDGRVVAGVGINVGQEPDDFPPAIRDRAGSLASVTGLRLSRSRLARELLGALREVFRRPPGRIEGEIARELDRADRLRGRRVRASGGLEGEAVGIDPDGALRVRDDGGRVHRVVGGSVARADD